MAAGSPELGDGNMLYAVETTHYNGPWQNNENLEKFNGVLRYSNNVGEDKFNVTALAYHAEWDSTDQIPRRAIEDGRMFRLGAVDPTDGGRTSRYSLISNWQRDTATTSTKATLFGYYYRLNLFSNYTYFLDDPVNGNQFEQADRRIGSGGQVKHEFFRRGCWI